MKDFELYNPTRIIFGKKSMSELGKSLKHYGNKVLMIYGHASIKTNGLYDKVVEQLKGFEVKEFSGIEPNPRVETIRKAVALGKDFKPDILLAIGGGSVIDATKLISASINYNGDPWELVLDISKCSKWVPLATILTVSATGSEMNGGAVITNWTEHIKTSFGSINANPVFSICDPENTFTLSAEQTAYGLVDIYSHVLEQYMNTTLDTPLQDRFAEGILKTVIENSKVILKDLQNYNARANIMFCSTMALNGLLRCAVNQDWATHAIEHEFSAFYDIPHGAGLAVITPRWMSEVREQKKAKLSQYGKRIFGLTGTDDEVAAAAIKETYDLFNGFNIKMSFSDWQITDEHFPVMISRMVEDGIGEIRLTKEQLTNILNNCLKKDL
jgi:alcohol dehydrogenase